MAVWTPEIWNGKWRWNAQTARFADTNRHNKEQFQIVTVKGNHMKMETHVTLTDNSTCIWIWEGNFDGKLNPSKWAHDGSVMVDMAFYLLKDNIGTDAYMTPDGTKRGSEYWVLDQNKLSVWGSYTKAAGTQITQHPYFEEWERMGA